ncbi:MAG: hypothetical protein M1825_004927 [Sarcosagium campestre]|nr:MAG: hypothetical protein M1825_004927 [Sarcosagium campestre]
MASADVNPYLSNMFDPQDSPSAAASGNGLTSTRKRDELDDMFDYDAGMAEMFQDVDTSLNAPAEPSGPANRKRPADDLGIDEEVQITKKKRVNVKLDEEKLLSQQGIPKLRRIAKERLRFKGKGHEFSDVHKLLRVYQLWLDDLFPKAKFEDGIAIIEKLGHSRRLQTMRREWIDEGKPRASPVRDTSVDGLDDDTVENQKEGLDSGFPRSDGGEVRGEDVIADGYLRDEKIAHLHLGADDAEDAASVPGEDELDALLAEGMA